MTCPVLTTWCGHCGLRLLEVWYDVWVHETPIAPEAPDLCFTDDPFYTACPERTCS